MKTIPNDGQLISKAKMKNIIKTRDFGVGLITLIMLFNSNSYIQAQIFTNASKYWGNSTNWNPNTIPNAVDAVAQVNILTANINLTNTAENIAATGPYPFVIGQLQIGTGASGGIGASAGSANEQLRFAVSSGVPVIDYSAGMSINCKLYGNQGLYITNSAQNNKLLEFRYNTSTMQLTGKVEIATGACFEQNGDYTLGNPTNILQLDDGATWSTRTSLNTAGDTTPATRPILLNCPNTPANIGTYSTYPWRIFAPIGEMSAGSSLKMPGTIAGSTTYGAGVITMAATNTFTGPMIVAGGTLNFSNQFAFQNNTLTMSGGSVTFDKGIAGNAFNIGGLAGTGNLAVQNTTPAAILLTVGGNNANTIYSGVLSGAGTLTKVGAGTLDLQGSGNNTAGLVTVNSGLVILDKASTAGVHAINNGITLGGGTVQLSGSGGDQIVDTKTVTLNSGTFDLNGQTETIGGLAGNGGTNADSTLGTSATLQVKVASGSVTNGSTITGGNLIFGGAGTQAFSGVDNRDASVAGLTTSVTNGTLQLGSGGSVPAFGGATGIVVTSPGTLALNGTGTFTNGLSGTGSLSVNGPGTVTVASVDTHTGNTLVNSGTLAVPSGGIAVGGSIITVASNATLNVSGGAGAFILGAGQTLKGAGTVSGNFSVANGATNAGTLTYSGNITLQAGAVVNPGSVTAAGTITNSGSIVNAGSYQLLAYLAPTTTPGGGTNSLLVVTGNLNVGSGANAAKVVVNGAPGVGTYVLATFGTFSGTVANVTATGPSGLQTYTVQTNGNQLQLVVGGLGAQNLVWRGDGTANVWDVNNNGNTDWFNTGFSTADYFASGDVISFDNSSTNFTVTLTGTLTPQLGSVVMVNSTNSFAFTGTGALDGAVALTKTNSGTLTLQTANTFNGSVNLNGGVISVATVATAGTAQPLGQGASLAFNGGTLQYTGTGGTLGQSVTVGASGATVDQSGSAALTVSSSVSGSGSLTKTGTNQLVISASNTGYTGVTYVQNGQLQMNNANALGNGPSMVFATNSGASISVGGVTGTIVKPLTLAGVGGGNGALQVFSAATFSGAITLTNNASIGGTASNTISGIISGPGMLTKTGTGTHVLTATNIYSGGTLVAGGTLQFGNGGTNGWLGPVPVGWSSITNDGCLAFNHSDPVALTNSVTGGTNGWIHQIGIGILTLGASNNFTGGNVFNYPTIGLAFTGAVGVDGPVLVTNSYAFGVFGAAATAKVQLAGNISIPAPIAVWSSGLGVANIENVSGTNSIDQVFGLYGNNYWPITASGGLLSISTFSNVIFNSTYGRTLQLQGSANGSITNTIDPSFFWLQVQKDGTGTWSLEGSIEAPLGLVVNAGTLILDGGVNPLLRNQTISHTVAGGTLIVNGNLPVGTTSGNVAVNGGQIGGVGNISGNVSVASGAMVYPSARNGTNTSLLTIGGNLSLAGNLAVNLNKSLAQSNDVISVNGSAVKSGTGLVTLTNNGPALVVGDNFGIFSQSGYPLGVANGTALTINPVVRGSSAQYVTWTNNLAVDGSITVLAAAPLGTNAGLTSLALNPTDNLTPAFATNVFVYFATNTLGVTPTVTVTNADLTASNALVINGVFSQVLTSGVPSLVVTNLGAGSTNVLKVFITAQDTVTTNLYTINLTQLAVTVNTNTFTLGSKVSGGNLQLTWPSDRLGWRLWVQTNSLNNGLGTNWFVWPNSTTVTNVSIPIIPANPSVFFRMTYP